MDARLQQYEDKMKKAYEYLESDYMGIRAGRANPHVLDKLRVDYYGTPTPIQQVGNVTVPEARIIQIAPWEKSMIREIEKAIMTSDIGINPSNDGSVIRLVFPELTVKPLQGNKSAADLEIHLIRLAVEQSADDACHIGEVSVDEPYFVEYAEILQTPGGRSTAAGEQSGDFITEGKQMFCQICAILSGDSGDKSLFCHQPVSF